MRSTDVTVVAIGEDANIEQAGRLIREAGQSLLIVVAPSGISPAQESDFRAILAHVRRSGDDKRDRIIATKNKRVLEIAREEGWNEAIERIGLLRHALKGHTQEQEALRTFSPGFWRGQIRSQLQSLGLLSLPRLRIWILLIASLVVFLFVFFRLLPSATVHVWPLQETLTHTVNVYLVSTGAQVPTRVRTLPLYPVTVRAEKTLTFDDIGKEFTGTNAEVAMIVANEADEAYALRKGTRLTNQAGMIFRLQEDIFVEAGSTVTVKAVADPVDLYGEIMGERGNVPAGLKWEFPGLSPEERAVVYARNDEPGVGGTSSFINVLREEDLVIAQKKLESELRLTARQLVDEERETRNAQSENASFVELRYDELTYTSFDQFTLPREFLGAKVDSVPVSGTISYTVLLYDENALFEMLREELVDVVADDKEVLPESIRKEEMVLHVTDAPWEEPNINWVKITVDLSAQQRFTLDPATPVGLEFSRAVREAVVGKSVDEAEKIVKNMPEVSKVEVSLWPPWNRWLPSIPSNILITQEQ